MAKVLEIKEKRARIYRKFDREGDSYSLEEMRSPVPNILIKKATPHKNSLNYNSISSLTPNNYEGSSGSSNKRFSHRYAEEYKGGYKSWHEEGRGRDRRHRDSAPSNKVEPENVSVVTPVILTRDRSTTEPVKQEQSSRPDVKENETSKTEAVPVSKRQIQIASKPIALEVSVMPEHIMKSSVKILDDSLYWGDDLSAFLLDQNQFMVLAVVGLQGSGKSTIASFLADPSKAMKLSSPLVFRPESKDEVLRGSHSTSGMDAFITKDRVIILDLQPLLSPSVMDYVVTQERKASLDYSSTENLLEVESLQLLTLAMSVAHVMLVIQDYILQPNLLRLLHSCQMMKPAQSGSSGGSSSRDASRNAFNFSQQYFPHLIFVHNRAFPNNFTPKATEEIQMLYQLAMADSGFFLESQIGINSGTFTPPLNVASSSVHLNFFLLPDFERQDQCPVSFFEALMEMRRQVFSLARSPLTHTTLTEKTWFQFASRMWDSIRKSNLFVEYCHLLP